MRFDLRESPTVLREWKALPTALDAHEMRERLQAAFTKGLRGDYAIERCAVDDVTYLPEIDRFHLTYELSLRKRTGGSGRAALVAARMFSSAAACEDYRREKLAPLVTRVAGREEIYPFSSPAAVVTALNMVVSIFPVDAELPTLVDATDPRHMTEVFRELLPVTVDAPKVQDCRIEVCQYRRRNRCVLRYDVASGRSGSDAVESTVVYGKIHASAQGTLVMEAVQALRDHARVPVPRPLGTRPELQLMLLEAIPGRRRVTRLLKRRLRGKPRKPGLTLEDSLDACARIAMELHGSGITLGPCRTLEDDLKQLHERLATIRSTSPELARLLSDRHDRIAADAAGSPPLRLRFAHGDFKASQVLFHAETAGLVDFDTICQAEPARDLGHFLAYLSVSILKEQRDGAKRMSDELGRRFVDTYLTGAGDRLEDEERLRTRIPLHRASALLHLAIKSWAKLKTDRLDYAITLLDETITKDPR